ncbi:DUF1289 domain-containing protein [Phreatobacter stygius]|uniref:DUF1289 domain-containing protein n=1 Tax=Phreatobacter stygius TaxID=1940610 RepID=A0A4D7BI28_9HYPH|nr:DUF1289 domain-containing protein [Phreatobacter stygius]QCI69348.1 DUF1289 domain-containing protein [Phreatobacter stygius]
METPCVKICVIHPTAGICEGCGRTLAEIGGWLTLSADDRRRVMATLPARLSQLSSLS